VKQLYALYVNHLEIATIENLTISSSEQLKSMLHATWRGKRKDLLGCEDGVTVSPELLMAQHGLRIHRTNWSPSIWGHPGSQVRD
jgi:hypothetical protein